MRSALWTPSEDRIVHSNIFSFLKYANQITGRYFQNYNELYDWSVSDIEEFWKSIWVISGIIHSHKYTSILKNKAMPGGVWFDGAKLNFAENLLKYRDSNTAIISARENYPDINISYQELYKLTASVAFNFRKMGLKKGDRVAGFITNIPEAVI